MAKKPNTREAADAGLIDVTLAAPHTHDGERLKKGDSLQVSPARAAWLARQGIIASPAEPEPEPET